MNNKQIKLKLLTPLGTILDCMVDMVLLPGIDGEFGVLYGHESMVSALSAGLLNIYNNEEVTESIFISEGLAEIKPEVCCVMVDEALYKNRLDQDRIEIEENLAQLRLKLSMQEISDFDRRSLARKIEFFVRALGQ